MKDFAVYFNPFRKQTEEDPEAEEINARNEILDFAETAYFAKFLGWLEHEASIPLTVGNHMDMIQSAVRANTLREIRTTLVRRVELARAATTDDQE